MTSFTSATTSFGSRTALISLLALASACSDDHPCIEYERTIDHGIYGEVVYKTFEGGHTPLYDVVIHLQHLTQPWTAETRSNEDGLYQVELLDGTASYSICADFAGAACQTITSTTLIRLDLVVEEGQVFWDETNYGECP